MKIIVHIGAGKTGTSSIQQTLLDNFEVLLSNGVLYAGRSFNSLGNDKSWKNRNLGYGLDKDLITNTYIKEFESYLMYGEKYKCHTLILCNEAFSADIEKLFDFFSYLNSKQHTLKICYFVRGPENWTKSAYEQWAIRHKTYKGEILSAKEYIALKTYWSLIKPIKTLINSEYYSSLEIINLEAVSDAVDAFVTKYNLPKVESKNVNKSVDMASLGFYYFLNNKVKNVASNKKGTILSKIYKEINNVENFQEKIEVKPQYYDFEDISRFKEDINQYLDAENAFSLDFNIRLKNNEQLSERELKLIKLSSEMFEIAYQSYLRRDVLKKVVDGDLDLDGNEVHQLSRLLKYLDRYFI